MFRLVELLEKQQNQPASARKVPTGRILIDGVDIATVGLHTLRQRITIIPQVRNVSVSRASRLSMAYSIFIDGVCRAGRLSARPSSFLICHAVLCACC